MCSFSFDDDDGDDNGGEDGDDEASQQSIRTYFPFPLLMPFLKADGLFPLTF